MILMHVLHCQIFSVADLGQVRRDVQEAMLRWLDENKRHLALDWVRRWGVMWKVEWQDNIALFTGVVRMTCLFLFLFVESLVSFAKTHPEFRAETILVVLHLDLFPGLEDYRFIERELRKLELSAAARQVFIEDF